MSITDPQLVNIEIVTLPGDRTSRLRLTYREQIYNPIRVFASHKLDLAQQQLQHLNTIDTDKYLLVREANYYSLWQLDPLLSQTASRLTPKTSISNDRLASGNGETGVELQQASIWLLQELWLQWQNLVGERQLHSFVETLLAQTPQLQTQVDLDRLLSLDPLANSNLGAWTELDWIAFDRQLYQLTQKKIGQRFATNLTSDILAAMPTTLGSILANILSI
jgi:hypothetical protein